MCISKFEVTERNVLRVANLSTFQWNMKCFEMLKKSADFENNDTECPITKFWSTCHELPLFQMHFLSLSGSAAYWGSGTSDSFICL